MQNREVILFEDADIPYDQLWVGRKRFIRNKKMNVTQCQTPTSSYITEILAFLYRFSSDREPDFQDVHIQADPTPILPSSPRTIVVE